MGCVSSLLGRKVRLGRVPIIPNDATTWNRLSNLVGKVGECVAVAHDDGFVMALLVPGEKGLVSSERFEYEILPAEIPGYDPEKAMLDYQVRTGQV